MRYFICLLMILSGSLWAAENSLSDALSHFEAAETSLHKHHFSKAFEEGSLAIQKAQEAESEDITLDREQVREFLDTLGGFIQITQHCLNADAYEESYQFTEAYEEYAQAIQIADKLEQSFFGNLSSALYNGRAHILMLQGNYEDAIEDFSHVIQKSHSAEELNIEELFKAYQGRANAYFLLKRMSESLCDLAACEKIGKMKKQGMQNESEEDEESETRSMRNQDTITFKFKH